MALFGNKKEDTKQVSAEERVAQPTAPQAAVGRDLSSVILKPRITEKGVIAQDKNVYVFEVRQDATKYDVRDAVKEVFGVTPVKVHTVTKKPREHMSRARGRRMTEQGLKKAYVYLKNGDTINLV